jgi:hypothetical protein
MKKKIKILGLMVLVVLMLVITLVTTQSKLEATNKGQWIYDQDGNHCGCKSPGNDCSWSLPFEEQ